MCSEIPIMQALLLTLHCCCCCCCIAKPYAGSHPHRTLPPLVDSSLIKLIIVVLRTRKTASVISFSEFDRQLTPLSETAQLCNQSSVVSDIADRMRQSSYQFFWFCDYIDLTFVDHLSETALNFPGTSSFDCCYASAAYPMGRRRHYVFDLSVCLCMRATGLLSILVTAIINSEPDSAGGRPGVQLNCGSLGGRL